MTVQAGFGVQGSGGGLKGLRRGQQRCTPKSRGEEHGACHGLRVQDTTLVTTQGRIDGFFSQLPFKCYLPEVVSVGDWLKIWCRVQGLLTPRAPEVAVGKLVTYKIVKARFWTWFSGKSHQNLLQCSLFARKTAHSETGITCRRLEQRAARGRSVQDRLVSSRWSLPSLV